MNVNGPYRRLSESNDIRVYDMSGENKFVHRCRICRTMPICGTASSVFEVLNLLHRSFKP
jgi:hypothetical protein